MTIETDDFKTKMNMRLILFFVLLIVVIDTAKGKVYTLDELISNAISNTNSIKSIEQEMRKAESYVQEVSAGALPVVSVSVNASHAFKSYVPNMAQSDKSLSDYLHYEGIDTSAERGSYLVANSLETILDNIGKQKENVGTFGLQVNQMIYAQGKISIGARIAKIQRSTLNCKLQEEKHLVKGMIIKLFYASLLAQKNVQVTHEAVNIAKEAHRLTVMKYELGKATELDTLNSRLHLRKTEIEYQNTESDLKIKYQTLLKNAGIDESVSNFSVEGDFPEIEFDMTVDMAIDKMKEKNYTLSQMIGLSEIQDLKIKLAKNAFSPTIFAGLSINKIGQFDHLKSDNLDWGNDQKVYIGANWDIYNGSVRMQRYYQAIAERTIFTLTRQQCTDDLVLATRNAYERIVVSKDQVTNTAEIVNLAEKSLSIAKLSYEVGTTTYNDMQNVELELHKAKVMNNAALCAFHTALTDLLILLGTL